MKCATSVLSFEADISIEKTNSQQTYKAGEDVVYEIKVSNEGPFGAGDLLVNDPLPDGITEASWTCSEAGGGNCDVLSGVGAIENADVDLGVDDFVVFTVTMSVPADFEGELVNVATVDVPSSVDDPDPTNNTSTDTDVQGDVSLTKDGELEDANANGRPDAGERINYTFTVTNKGTSPLTNISVSDPQAEITGTIASLAAGESDSTSITGHHVLTQEEIDSGSYSNVALVEAEDLDGDPVMAHSAPSGETEGAPTVVDLLAEGATTLEKSSQLNDANGNGAPDVGEVIDYTFTVTNTGNVTLTDVAVTDDKATISGSPIASVEPGVSDSTSVTGVYTVTQEDIDAGSVDNVATATGKDPAGNDVTVQSNPPGGAPGDPTTTEMMQNSEMDFVKEVTHDDANGNGTVDAGERMNYQFTVENTGNVTLTNATVTDSKATIVGGPIPTLEPGEVDATTITGYHDVTQEEVNSGNIENNASVSAKDPAGNDVTRDSRPPGGEPGDSTNFTVETVSSMETVKESTLNDANGNGAPDVGEVIDYTFTVTNTGNVTLTDVAVTDDKATISGSPIASVEPGVSDSTSVTGVYTVTQEDINAGSVDNVATATGKDPAGNDVTVQSNPPGGAPGDPTTTEMTQNSEMDFVKEVTHDDANGNGTVDAGERMNYQFTVENTGNVTLTNATVTDSKATIVGGPIPTLEPGEVDATTITGYHDVTQEEVNSGNIENNASVSAKDPAGNDVTRDSRPPGGEPGDSTNFTVETVSSMETVKESTLNDANGNGAPDVGEVIDYTFTVTNTGNVTLTDVAVTDDKATISGSPIASVEPGVSDSTSVTGVYTVTQEDINAGSVDNVATATGKDPAGNDVTVQSNPPGGAPGDPTTTEMTQNSEMDFVKEVTHDDANGNGTVDAGERMNYQFTVENTGNVTLTNATVTDSKATIVGGPIPTLEPGEVDATTITGYHDVTQEEVNSGNIENNASVSAKDPAGNDVTRDSRPPGGEPGDSTNFTVETVSSMETVKESTLNDANGNGAPDVGEVIDYTFTVTNTGNVTLTDVAVTDDKATISGSPIASVEPGVSDSTSVTGVYTVTQEDIDAGSVDNVATATGKDPAGNDVTVQSNPPGGAPGDPTTTEMMQNSEMDFVKEVTHDDANGNGTVDAGERMNYQFTVENTGNVTLTNATVTDSKATIVGGPIPTLEPGEVDATTITGYHDVTQEEVNSGNIENNASVSAKDPAGNDVTRDSRPPGGEPGDSTNFTVETVSSMETVKESTLNDANGNGAPDVGEVIDYTFTVTNTGNVTLTDVAVTDDKATISGSPIASVEPGVSDSTSVTGVYTVTQEDINAGSVDNVATATGKDPAGNDVTVQSNPPGGAPGDPTTTEMTQNSEMDFVKEVTHDDANGNGTVDAGERMNYQFTVENTGNVTLTNATVTDSKATIVGGPIPTLEPGEVDATTITGYHDVTQEEVNSGNIENNASVSAKDPAGNDVTRDSRPPGGEPGDSTNFTVETVSSMETVKESTLNDANGNGAPDVGEVIDYTFTVTNTGNVTLTDVAVTDDKATISGSPIASVEPGVSDSTSVTGVYTVTQEDINAGSVDNVATATGKDPAGNDVTVQSNPPGGAPGDPTTTEMTQNSEMDFVKEVTHDDANGNGFIDVGERLNYQFTVENTGNVTLTDATVTDSKATIVGGPIPSLDPGEVDATTITGYHDVTQEEVDSGNIENTASASAKDPAGNDVTRDSRPPDGEPGDTTNMTVEYNSSMETVKESALNDTNANGLPDVGEVIDYTFTVTNTGNVTLTDVAVTDDKATISGSPIATLEPGVSDSTSVTGVYTVTQEDIDAGSVDNVATTTGKDPAGNDVTVQSNPPGGAPGDPATTEMTQHSEMDFIKEASHDDANGNGFVDAGERLNYLFTVVNTGNVTLTNATVTDSKATIVGGPIPSLAPGEVDATTITGYHDVTQEDVDSGNVENTASASAKDPAGNDVTQTSRPPGGEPGDSTNFDVAGNGQVDIVKEAELDDANGNGFADAGETVNYIFTVTNTGNVTLTDVEVTDDKATVSGSPIARLEPGVSDSTSVTGVYTIAQQDIDSGSFENVASATGKDPKGEDVTAQSRPTDGEPGDTTLITFEPNPAIEVELVDTLRDDDTSEFPDPGEALVYTIKIRNTGNLTVHNISAQEMDVASEIAPASTMEPQESVPVSGGVLQELSPGEEDSGTFSVLYPLTQDDVDEGMIVASVKAAGVAANGTPVEDASDDPEDSENVDMEGDAEPDDPTDTRLLQHPSLSMVKTGTFQGTADEFAEPGDTILYTFMVTNDGNVTLRNVVPSDPGPRFDGKPGTGTMTGFTPESADLGADESETFTATYTLTQADIDAAQGVENGIKNKATASGTGPRGQEAVSPEAEAVVEIPGFAINKTAGFTEVQRGDRVPYTIRVKPIAYQNAVIFDVVDMMPPGFAFVKGSANIDGKAVAPTVEGRKLTFEDIFVPESMPVEISFDLAVSAAVKPGEYINRTWVQDQFDEKVSRVATALVEVVVEAVFDCGDIIGKVFNDVNRNGYQDSGEPGLAGVRVTTVKGLLLTADDHGRFHVACADLPDQRIGTNYIMKLDPRSLPTGYRLTTENPRVVRLTAGKASEFSFGASVGRVVRLDVSDAAFVEGTVELHPEWALQFGQMIALLDKEPSVLRLNYTSSGESKRLAQKRLNAIRKMIREEWKSVGGRYRLEIETRMQRVRNAAPRPSNRRSVYK
ncbi:hypothetical protein AB2N04_11000 [Nitratireductor sp. GISD-1A_MAKvit]|uniref:DUF7507 domain-containing protein n=1 Tax=Nitratireductor sp. GISD-1A_MAKvit TaxID=3234198 RepID=UPI00346777A8